MTLKKSSLHFVGNWRFLISNYSTRWHRMNLLKRSRRMVDGRIFLKTSASLSLIESWMSLISAGSILMDSTFKRVCLESVTQIWLTKNRIQFVYFLCFFTCRTQITQHTRLCSSWWSIHGTRLSTELSSGVHSRLRYFLCAILNRNLILKFRLRTLQRKNQSSSCL